MPRKAVGSEKKRYNKFEVVIYILQIIYKCTKILNYELEHLIWIIILK